MKLTIAAVTRAVPTGVVLGAALALGTTAMTAGAQSPAAGGSRVASAAPPSVRDTSMVQFGPLVGAPWTAAGSGFSTTLSYRWIFPGTLLGATNEVRSGEGRVIARYNGAYAWDPSRNEITFWDASDSGELHRGRAWWRDGILWHEAEVSGGRISGYASAVRPGDDSMEYFADYSRRDAGDFLLETEALTYTRADAALTSGPLEPLAFMSGCWRRESGGAGAVLEEIHTTPSENLMLGLSRYLRNGRAVQYEFSRITADTGGVVLLPYPGGRPSEHGFHLTHVDEASALFEAPEHDFPRRIRYTLTEDGSLVARIDGGEGDERVQEWRMEAVSCRV